MPVHGALPKRPGKRPRPVKGRVRPSLPGRANTAAVGAVSKLRPARQRGR